MRHRYIITLNDSVADDENFRRILTEVEASGHTITHKLPMFKIFVVLLNEQEAEIFSDKYSTETSIEKEKNTHIQR
jgi:hypothetical protein